MENFQLLSLFSASFLVCQQLLSACLVHKVLDRRSNKHGPALHSRLSSGNPSAAGI